MRIVPISKRAHSSLNLTELDSIKWFWKITFADIGTVLPAYLHNLLSLTSC